MWKQQIKHIDLVHLSPPHPPNVKDNFPSLPHCKPFWNPLGWIKASSLPTVSVGWSHGDRSSTNLCMWSSPLPEVWGSVSSPHHPLPYDFWSLSYKERRRHSHELRICLHSSIQDTSAFVSEWPGSCLKLSQIKLMYLALLVLGNKVIVRAAISASFGDLLTQQF